MMKSYRLITALCITVIAVTASAWSAPPSRNGPLRVHPQNRRYFTDNAGRAIYLTGSHTWSNLMDMGPTGPPAPFDFEAWTG